MRYTPTAQSAGALWAAGERNVTRTAGAYDGLWYYHVYGRVARRA